MSRRKPSRGRTKVPVFEAARDAPSIASLARAEDVPLDESQLRSLASYAALVATWTLRVDLVATRGARELVELLFLDAFVLAKSGWISEGARVIDVGAGGGAPTIPLALLRPDLRALLVEPRQKRGAFLRTACASLGLLERAKVEQSRIEPDSPDVDANDFDLALSRATFAPEIWVPLGLRLAPRCVALLGSAEWPADQGAPVDARDYVVPSSGAKRRALLFER
ncbi:MAG: hypothetical protein GXP55_03980 [Deltaproteobacteria bacterium]|nr:hypothetical protein [Deltaproteobacteria bacterium]